MHSSLRSGRRLAACSLGLFMLAACAGAEPPRAELGAAQAAILSAERSGAIQRAPVELNSARTKYERATAAVRADDNERAARLAREAEIDAQLASAKAQADAAREAARQVREGTSTLGREVRPPQPAQ